MEQAKSSLKAERETFLNRLKARRTRWVAIALGVLLVVVIGAGLVTYFVPRFHWRAQIVHLKIKGALPNISWKELYHFQGHGDPFNLKGLVSEHNPYYVITNPFDSPDDIRTGEKLFQSNCSSCHGSDGAGGGAGPVLKQRHMVQGSSSWALFKTISNGIGGTAMPASSLSETDRWRLAAFVHSLAEGPQGNVQSPLMARLAKIPMVRYEDILGAQQDPHQWLTYSGTYDGQRFSTNEQLNAGNVSNLRLVWMHQYTAQDTAIETSPLVVGGFMFVTIPPGRVEALDAETGELIWAYDRTLPQQLSLCCGLVNRGLAVLGKTLFLGTLDAHLVALDITTGAVLWDVEIGDYRQGYSITGAPLALKNMVITGVAGGEYGVRGFVTARDAATGREIWRFNAIPQPGQPGSETWDDQSALKTGGGPTWLTGTYDKELNVILWPVGNPSPNYEGDTRRGDNLYTNSVVALDADHGTLRWYFQFTPHDQHDWDATEIPISFDKTIGGKVQHFLGQADRNAFYYVLDRENGQFITAKPFARETWAKSIDSRGRPVVDPTSVPSAEGSTTYPWVGGATNWMSPSLSPVTGFVYVPVREAEGNFFASTPAYQPGELFLGGHSQTIPDPPQLAAVRAVDAMTGQTRWEYRYESWSAGGLLSTKGGLVFGSLGHLFLALDAKTGRELWKVDTGGWVKAAPVTYSLGGKQYVTVAAGHDLLTFTE
jgi:alcohol dehydrogenase (cytochrome c)